MSFLKQAMARARPAEEIAAERRAEELHLAAQADARRMEELADWVIGRRDGEGS